MLAYADTPIHKYYKIYSICDPNDARNPRLILRNLLVSIFGTSCHNAVLRNTFRFEMILIIVTYFQD